MKAVKKFKGLLHIKRPEIIDDILGEHSHIVRPPLSMLSPDASPIPRRSRSMDSNDRRTTEQALAVEGVHRDIDLKDFNDSTRPPPPSNQEESHQAHPGTHEPVNPESRHHHDSPDRAATPPTRTSTSSSSTHGKGHAHDPLSDHFFLGLGPGGHDGPDENNGTDNGDNDAVAPPPPDPPIVSESPPAADIDIYETAYHNEIERIQRMHGEQATTFLTRRIESPGAGRTPQEGGEDTGGKSVGLGGGLAKALQLVREKENAKT